MPLMSPGKWFKRFKAAAKADKYRLLHRYACELCDESPDQTDDMGKGVFGETVNLVERECAFDAFGPDHEDPEIDEFLRMQTYDPKNSRNARYIIGIERNASPLVPARILANTVDFTDLANLHIAIRISRIFVSRRDGRRMPVSEVRRICEDVRSDVSSDFGDMLKLRCYTYGTLVMIDFFDLDELDDLEDYLCVGHRVSYSVRVR